MKIQDILDIQGDALAKTVCDYTSNNYIRSYAKKLTDYKYPEDKEKLKIVIEYLIDWYDGVIEKIKNDEYVVSKESHFKSYGLLKEVIAQMDHGDE